MIGAGALTLVATLTLATLASPLTVGAQQTAKAPRIGVLFASTPVP